MRSVSCQVIGELIKRSPKLIGELIKSTGDPARGVTLRALAGHLLAVPPGPALQVHLQDQQLRDPHRGLEHVPHRWACGCRGALPPACPSVPGVLDAFLARHSTAFTFEGVVIQPSALSRDVGPLCAAGHVMINRVDNRSMMQCLLKCNELLKQVRQLPCLSPLAPLLLYP